MDTVSSLRNDACPICGARTDRLLSLELGPKANLPSRLPHHYCERDQFVFVAAGDQASYDDYYRGVTNDSNHREVAGAEGPASQQARLLARLLGEVPARVLDFGCGSGDLLAELAMSNPQSRFLGVDPSGPALLVARSRLAGIPNAEVAPPEAAASSGPFDLIIMSHVLEHMIDFGVLAHAAALLREGGLLYVEVPDALSYEKYERLEFIYYLDRLHVNHFTAQAISAITTPLGFGVVDEIVREFPYRDQRPYPALGVLLQRGAATQKASSPDLRASLQRYVANDRRRCASIAQHLSELPGALVWGAGDNFHRAISEGGPLSRLKDFVILDRRPQHVVVRGVGHDTRDPEEAILNISWPIVVTVSEFRGDITRIISKSDASRQVYMV